MGPEGRNVRRISPLAPPLASLPAQQQSAGGEHGHTGQQLSMTDSFLL